MVTCKICKNHEKQSSIRIVLAVENCKKGEGERVGIGWSDHRGDVEDN